MQLVPIELLAADRLRYRTVVITDLESQLSFSNILASNIGRNSQGDRAGWRMWDGMHHLATASPTLKSSSILSRLGSSVVQNVSVVTEI